MLIFQLQYKEEAHTKGRRQHAVVAMQNILQLKNKYKILKLQRIHINGEVLKHIHINARIMPPAK